MWMACFEGKNSDSRWRLMNAAVSHLLLQYLRWCKRCFFRSVTVYWRGGAEVTKIQRFVEIGQARMVGTVISLRRGRSGIWTLSQEKDFPPVKLGGGGTLWRSWGTALQVGRLRLRFPFVLLEFFISFRPVPSLDSAWYRNGHKEYFLRR
jgi:hypothetical protein